MRLMAMDRNIAPQVADDLAILSTVMHLDKGKLQFLDPNSKIITEHISGLVSNDAKAKIGEILLDSQRRENATKALIDYLNQPGGSGHFMSAMSRQRRPYAVRQLFDYGYIRKETPLAVIQTLFYLAMLKWIFTQLDNQTNAP